MPCKKPQSHYIIVEIARKANEAGMSYGHYVAKNPLLFHTKTQQSFKKQRLRNTEKSVPILVQNREE